MGKTGGSQADQGAGPGSRQVPSAYPASRVALSKAIISILLDRIFRIVYRSRRILVASSLAAFTMAEDGAAEQLKNLAFEKEVRTRHARYPKA